MFSILNLESWSKILLLNFLGVCFVEWIRVLLKWVGNKIKWLYWDSCRLGW